MTEYTTWADFKGHGPERRWIIALAACIVVGLVVIAWSPPAI